MLRLTERPERLTNMEGRQLSHSQNFLKSSEFVGMLIGSAGIKKEDFVVEIGPGKGIIARELSKKAGKVVGVETDPNLARNLRAGFSDSENVEIIESDFLKWDLPRQPYKVFANIPFNMTADIVKKLLFAENPPEAAYLIMQDRAAGRFMGPPYGPTSQMSTLLQPFYNMGIIAKVDRREFEPVPNVNAVLARFEKREQPLVPRDQQSLYRDFVIYGYNQWKPTLTEALKGVFGRKQLSIVERNFNLKGLKPSELNIEQWTGIFGVFIQHIPQDKKDIVKGAEKRQRLKQSNMKKEYRTRDRSRRR